MRRLLTGTLALGAVGLCVAMAASQPPAGRGRGGPGGPPRFQLGQVLPPFVRDELKLTKEQEEDIAKLEKEVKERLGKILTDEQKKKLETLRPPGRGGPGGPGGSPPDGPPNRGGSPPSPPEKQEASADPSQPGIQWFATLESGLREAKRTGRPILFVSAAPHCAGVPGIW